MRKTILTILGSALIVAISVQFADAAQRRHRGKAVANQQQTRNADAYASWPAPVASQPDWSRYSSGALSAPAGH